MRNRWRLNFFFKAKIVVNRPFHNEEILWPVEAYPTLINRDIEMKTVIANVTIQF